MPPTSAATTATVGSGPTTAALAAPSPKPPASGRKRSRADGEGADDCGAVSVGINILDAARLGQVAALKQLLSKAGAASTQLLFATTDADGRAPLALAAASGNVAAVAMLLDAGAELEAADERGWRALHAAAASGHGGVVRSLLACGADPQAPDCDGCCPHHLAAAASGPGAVVALEGLIEAGAPIEACDARGWRALHFAASARSAAAVETLLTTGADATAATVAGWRALHFAASKGDAASVKAILAASDDPASSVDAAAADGRRPHDLAIAAGELAALQLLLEAGAARFVALDCGRAVSAALRVHGERGAEVATALARAGAQLPSVGAARRLGREAAAVVRALRRELADSKPHTPGAAKKGSDKVTVGAVAEVASITEEAEPTVVGVGCKRRRRQAGL